MAVDQPIIVHPRDKSKPPSAKKMRRIAEEWEKNRSERESLVGKKVSLSDLLKPKKEEQSDGRQ